MTVSVWTFVATEAILLVCAYTSSKYIGCDFSIAINWKLSSI